MRRDLPMLKLVLFIPREHAVGGWRRRVEEVDGRYRPGGIPG